MEMGTIKVSREMQIMLMTPKVWHDINFELKTNEDGGMAQ